MGNSQSSTTIPPPSSNSGQPTITSMINKVEESTSKNVELIGKKVEEKTGVKVNDKVGSVLQKVQEKTGIDLQLNPKDEFYGDITLLEFLSTVWSRLAYMDTVNFVSHYKHIFKDENVVNKTTFVQEEEKKQTTIIGNEETITIKNVMKKISNDPSYLNTFVKFLPLAEQINIINGEQAKAQKNSLFSMKSRTPEELNCGYDLPLPENDSMNLLYTSIGTSNYSQCSVFSDIRIPDTIMVVFRGTYSAKSAGSYTQFTSLLPTQISKDSKVKVLSGVYKIMIEMVHTILNAIEDMKHQLKQYNTGNKEFKLIITGHSLGGALATLFTYVYAKTTTFKKNSVSCISIGAPRVFNTEGAIEFCNMCTGENPLFLFKRITTYNDPVPMIPKVGYQHPCSDQTQLDKRMKISTDCLVQSSNSLSKRCATTMRLAMTPDYKLPLRCTNKKDRKRVFNKTESPILAMFVGYFICRSSRCNNIYD